MTETMVQEIKIDSILHLGLHAITTEIVRVRILNHVWKLTLLLHI